MNNRGSLRCFPEKIDELVDSVLDANDAKIVKMNFGLNCDPIGFSEIEKKLGLKKGSARRRILRSLNKLEANFIKFGVCEYA